MTVRATEGDVAGDSGDHVVPTAALRGRLARAVEAAPIVFAVVAEGAWVSVAASLVQEYALAEVVVGLPAMIAIAGAGAILARALGPRTGRRWPVIASTLTVLVGAVGWLAAPGARAAIADESVAAALGANPGGWFAGMALLRGFRHARLPLHEPTLALLLGLGIPCLAFAAIAGGMIAEPWRGRFLTDALVAATIFAASATLALALARLTAVGADAGFDWRRNPPWIVLVGLLVAAVAVVAQPAAAVAGPLIPIALGIVAGPLLLVAFVLGFSRRAAWFIFIAAAVTIVYVGLVALFSDGGATPRVVTGGSIRGAEPAPPGDEVLVGAALILVAAAVAVAILVRLWMRRSQSDDADPTESRVIDRGGSAVRPRRLRRRRFGRRPDPVDAVSAYRAIDEALRPTALRRRPGETPAEHARRLRAGGATPAGLALDLLAADYALARFGGVPLSPAEDRRAVERWRLLRRSLTERAARLGR
jgi:hypothetical protein